MNEPLRTRRLIIRRFTPADLGDFCAYQADPLVREHQHGQPLDVEQAARYLAEQAMLDEREVGCWHGLAVEHAETGTVIGDLGVFLDSSVEGDIGFQFHPGYHRQGYGTEAMSAYLARVFETLRLDRVTADTDEANAASRALLDRLGLRRQPPGDADGSCHYELTRAEWLSPRRDVRS